MLFRAGLSIDFIGEESLEVPAGRFDALHFKFVSAQGLPVEHPPYELWCTADGDYVFLKGVIGGYMQTQYELAELVHSKD